MEASNHGRRSSAASQMRTPRAHRICDGITEAVLYFQVVFPPWAFGATEHWSIWTMNAAGYALGALLFAKWWIRWRVGYRPARWGEGENQVSEDGRGQTENVERGGVRRERQRSPIAKRLTFSLAALTVLVLAYCLISSINARSTFVSQQMAFVPHGYIAWLPHSYDNSASWQAFWMDLGLALSFWAGRDWLLGKTAKERRGAKAEDRVWGEDAALRAAQRM